MPSSTLLRLTNTSYRELQIPTGVFTSRGRGPQLGGYPGKLTRFSPRATKRRLDGLPGRFTRLEKSVAPATPTQLVKHRKAGEIPGHPFQLRAWLDGCPGELTWNLSKSNHCIALHHPGYLEVFCWLTHQPAAKRAAPACLYHLTSPHPPRPWPTTLPC
jgi:hypothetical protein